MANKVDARIEKIKLLHKEAFKIISDAIENEENKGHSSISIDLYKKGIEKLKEGISIPISGNEERVQKYRAIQEKMRVNLRMATERLEVLNAPASKANKGDGSAQNSSARPKALDSKPTLRANYPSTSAKRPPDPRPSSSKPRNALDNVDRRVKPQTPIQPRPIDKSINGRVKNVDPNLANIILNEVLDKGLPVTFADIAGNDGAKSALQEMIILPTRRPDLFTGIRAPIRGLLLFGPPGNGKTLLAKAVAHESGCVFFNISAATLVSKWVGESEKLVRALFAMARELQPCIVFLDEVDSLLSARKTEDKESTRRLLTQFLQEFDGVASSPDDRVIVIAATNRPQDLDDAALRRFPKRLLIPMPDVGVRQEMLRTLLRDVDHSLSENELLRVARLAENYSASDLHQLTKDAAMGPLREMRPDKLLTMDKSAIRPMKLSDFEDSLSRIRPSLNATHLSQYNEWAEKYAQLS